MKQIPGLALVLLCLWVPWPGGSICCLWNKHMAKQPWFPSLSLTPNHNLQLVFMDVYIWEQLCLVGSVYFVVNYLIFSSSLEYSKKERKVLVICQRFEDCFYSGDDPDFNLMDEGFVFCFCCTFLPPVATKEEMWICFLHAVTVWLFAKLLLLLN